MKRMCSRNLLCVMVLYSGLAPGPPFAGRIAAEPGTEQPRTDVQRTFEVKHDQPKVSGYAEVALDVERQKGESFHLRTRVWFHGRERYRIESTSEMGKSGSPDLSIYEVRLGRRRYNALVKLDAPDRTRWHAWPAVWQPNSLDTYLQPEWTIKDAELVGRDRIHGLAAEHWRGVGGEKSGGGTTDIWLSTDPRFPITLRVDRKSATSTLNWRITELDLVSRVPDYVFTPQVKPKAGFIHKLLLPFKPPLLTIVWHSLHLLALSGVLVAFLWRPGRGRTHYRILLCIGSVAAWCFAHVSGSNITQYFYLLSDTPVALGFVILSGAFIFVMIRVIGRPGDVSFFGGTTWASMLFIAAALLAGGAKSHVYQRALSSSMNLTDWGLAFVGPLVVNVLLFVLALAAIEEVVFRGYLFDALLRRFKSVPVTVLIQALVFAVYHIPSRIQHDGFTATLLFSIIALTIFGIVFGVLRHRYRNLGVPWLVHASYNLGALYVFHSAAIRMAKAIESY